MQEKQRPAGQGQAANDAQNESPNFSARVHALQARANDEDPSVDVEGFKPLLPEGSYEARYLGHATAIMFGKSPKVFLHFEITEFGAHQGTRMFRAFRARRVKKPVGPGGAFALHAGGELYKTLVRLLEVRSRADRITLRPLRAMLFRIRLRTVTVDYDQRPLPEQSRYSTIQTIERGE
jgi:hypothetical protein